MSGTANTVLVLEHNLRSAYSYYNQLLLEALMLKVLLFIKKEHAMKFRMFEKSLLLITLTKRTKLKRFIFYNNTARRIRLAKRIKKSPELIHDFSVHSEM